MSRDPAPPHAARRDTARPDAAPRDTARRVRVATAHQLRLLVRQGVVAAALVTGGAWAVLVRVLPAEARPTALELVAFGQLAVLGYSFAGAAVLLDKAERTLLALTVTPLRLSEQLAARVAALTTLTVAATIPVVVAAGAPRSGALSFGTGVVAASVVALLTSLVVVAPHRSVSRWLLPSLPPMLLLALPAVAYLGVEGAWLWLIPSQGALTLLRGPATPSAAVLALAGTVVWATVLGALAQRRFARYVATADA